MSKRKSALVVNMTEDCAFEDQEMESPPVVKKKKSKASAAQSATPAASNASSSSLSRVSGRAKKVKSIYDPSESLKPAGKRKRDESVVSDIMKAAATSPFKAKAETSSLETETSKSAGRPKLEKAPAAARGVVQAAKTIAQTNGKSIEKVKRSLLNASVTISPSTAASKEPSKRILDKKKRVSLTESIKPIEKATPHEIVSKSSDGLPDVTEWSGHDVAEYFHNKLGFSKRDAALFRDEEIDGEALMIMKRSDIVNSKFSNIKLGTAIKFWSQILRLQTRSNDPTQAWV